MYLIALVAALFPLRTSLINYFAVLLLTAFGFPMMSGGRGGIFVLFGPSAGYIYGWIFIILIVSLSLKYITRFSKTKKIKFVALFSIIASLSLFPMYALGALVFILVNKLPISSFGSIYISNLTIFLIADFAKLILAGFTVCWFIKTPSFSKNLDNKI